MWVDDRLGFDLTGNIEAGRFGCMANSQTLVTCANVTIEALPAVPATGFVDLSDFTSERYRVLSPSRPITPTWDVTRDGSPFSVQQRLNAGPSVFYSPFLVSEAWIRFEVTVATDDDEDQFGFAVGYQPGDKLSPAAAFVAWCRKRFLDLLPIHSWLVLEFLMKESSSPVNVQNLFWELATELQAKDPRIVEGTIMNSRCLRVGKEFLALIDYKSSGLVVKLPKTRVAELIEQEIGQPFAPAKKPFKEWLSVPKPDRRRWRALLNEGVNFVAKRA